LVAAGDVAAKKLDDCSAKEKFSNE